MELKPEETMTVTIIKCQTLLYIVKLRNNRKCNNREAPKFNTTKMPHKRHNKAYYTLNRALSQSRLSSQHKKRPWGPSLASN